MRWQLSQLTRTAPCVRVHEQTATCLRSYYVAVVDGNKDTSALERILATPSNKICLAASKMMTRLIKKNTTNEYDDELVSFDPIILLCVLYPA